MATASRKAAPAPDPEPPVIAVDTLRQLLLDDDTFSSESLNPALESLYVEMGVGDSGEATVHVSKIDADNRGNEASIWKGDPDQYDLEQLARKFGSGQYRVKVYVRLPTGQKVVKANKTFAWLLSSEEEAARVAPKNPAVDIGATVANAIAEALRPLSQQIGVPAQSPMEMMRMAIDIAKAMAPPPQPATDPVSQMHNMMEMMKMMRELQDDADPIDKGINASTADVVLGLINQFGPAFKQVFSQAQQQQVGMGGQPAMLAQNPIPGQNSGQQLPQQETMQVMPIPQNNNQAIEDLKKGLGMLKAFSTVGFAPEGYANMVLDQVPEETILEMMAQPDPVGQLAAIDPDLNNEPHKTWFNALLTECKAILQEPIQDE